MIQGVIEVTNTEQETTRTYTINPKVTSYKNALQEGDKIVVYWINNPNANGYQAGPWKAEQKLEFDRTSLEADDVTGRELSLPYTDGNYIFAQAYLEYADGSRGDVTFSGGSGRFKWAYAGYGADDAFAGGYEYSVNSGGTYVPHYCVRLAY